MATVTVRQPATINVRVGNRPATVQSVTYGGRTLKSASDLNISGAQNGDVIVYDSANNNFSVTNISAGITDIDAGLF